MRSCLLLFRFLPVCGESHHFYALGFETLKVYRFSTLDSSVYIGAADFPSYICVLKRYPLLGNIVWHIPMTVPTRFDAVRVTTVCADGTQPF